MRSVADTFREDDARHLESLSPAERVEAALRLGRRSIAVYAAYNDVSEEEAALVLRRNNARGRVASRCISDCLG